MRTNRFVIGVLLGIGLAVAVGSVEAKEKPFHANFVGTIINKDDFSFVGEPATYSTVAGKSTLGQYTAQIVAEVPADGMPCLPGGGGLEFVYVGEVVVLSFAKRGEQLFLRLNPNVTSHACLDTSTGVGTGQTTFD